MIIKRRLMISFIGIVLFLSVMAIPGLCNDFNKDLCTCFGKSVKEDIHISYLSLTDAVTKTSTFYSNEAVLLNNAFKHALTKIPEDLGLNNIKVNANQKSIKNTDNNKKQLFQILTDPGMFFQEKTLAISKEYSEIDAIFMGEYREFKAQFEVYVYWILFHCQTYVIEKLVINKKEFFSTDSNGNTQICKKEKEHFEKILSSLIFKSCPLLQLHILPSWYVELMNKKIMPPKTPNHLYISHLSFIDPTTGTSIFHTNTGKLINDTVIKGINLAQKNVPFIKHNANGHILEDNDSQANTLVDIIFDRTMNKGDKLNKIIEKLMTPSDIDVIITGQYIDKGRYVDVRPFIIIKNERKLVPKAVQFKKAEFLCPDPIKKSNTVLCKDAQEEISRLVKELLEQL